LKANGTDVKYVEKKEMHKQMNKQLISVAMIILLIGIVSAVYPGETIKWKNDLSDSDLSYSIIKNSTALPGIIISMTQTQIFVTLPTNIPPCNFDIVFTKKEPQKEEKHPFWWFPPKNYFVKHIEINYHDDRNDNHNDKNNNNHNNQNNNRFYGFFPSLFRR
jgi:hypothetical protein